MIYIHIPFCHQKCTYCAFYSSPTRDDKGPYLDALCQELSHRSSEQNHPIRTIYFGGGTPSMLSISQLMQIISTLQSHFDLRELQEVTLEANPEDLTDEYLNHLSELHFFNRLSIGIQSFKDSDLIHLNRRHCGADAISAIERAHRWGFQNISIDLIYGLPGQTASDWAANLQQLSSISHLISHLSCYALTVEEGTMLHRQILNGTTTPADEEATLQHYQMLQDWIRLHNWYQYEISSYCKDGKKSLHNSRYWDATPYLGVGAGAHSFDGDHRRWNHPDIRSYIDGIQHNKPYFEQESLTPADKVNEYLMTALRTTEGISLDLIHTSHQWAEKELFAKVEKYIGTYISRSQSHLSPTTEGLLHADGIAADLFF